jgi:lipoprotein-anchoring transpeptidase ErfK/SrfK
MRNEPANRIMAAAAVVLLAAAKAMAEQQQAAAGASATPERRSVVSISDRKLALIEDGRVIRIYDTAVGAPKSPSPAGTFQVVRRVPNPTWYSKGKIVPPCSSNPVGTRWIGLSVKGYGIHGTNNPRSIGKNVSHGCIRMRNRDVEDLFTKVAVGDVVELHAERDEEIARIFTETVLVAAAAE